MANVAPAKAVISRLREMAFLNKNVVANNGENSLDQALPVTRGIKEHDVASSHGVPVSKYDSSEWNPQAVSSLVDDYPVTCDQCVFHGS